MEEEEITQTIARLLTSGIPSAFTAEDYSTISDFYTTEIPSTQEPTFIPTTTTTTTQSPRSRKIKKVRRTRPTSSSSAPSTDDDSSVYNVRRRQPVSTTTSTVAPVKTRGTVRRLVRKRPVTTTLRTTTVSDELEEENDDLDINIDNNIQRQSTNRFADPSEFSRPTRRFQPPVAKNEVDEEVKVEVKPTRSRFLLRTTTPVPESDESEEDIQLNFAVPDEEILNSVTSTRPTNRFTARPSLRPLNRFSLKPRVSENAEAGSTEKPGNTVKISTTRRPPSYRSKPTFSRGGGGSTTSTEATAVANKNSKLFTRTRNRNYANRFRGGDDKKEIDNEIEKIIDSTEIPEDSTSREAATTNIPTTTLKHVFAIDETSTVKPNSGDTAEEISSKLEKLVEINIIEEINTRVEKHKHKNKSNSSEVTLEKLPTNHKGAEISRLAVIKYFNGDDDKKSRILSSDTIFKTETSTIPLERLFELERQAKELRDSSTTEIASVTPVYIPAETTLNLDLTTLDDLTTLEGTTTQPKNPFANLENAKSSGNKTSEPLISSGYSQTTK